MSFSPLFCNSQIVKNGKLTGKWDVWMLLNPLWSRNRKLEHHTSLISPNHLLPVKIYLGYLRCMECTGFPLHSKKTITRTAGFEPARAEPNAFRVHLRNHLDTSATVPLQLLEESSKEQEEWTVFHRTKKRLCSRRGLNPRSQAHKTCALTTRPRERRALLSLDKATVV